VLRAALISNDNEVLEHLENLSRELGQFRIGRKFHRQPTESELIQCVRAYGPEVVFLSLEHVAKAGDIHATLEKASPGVQLVAVGRYGDPQVLLQLMRMGVREFLTLPVNLNEFEQMMARIRTILEKQPPTARSSDLLYSFLPAKAGCGTSTIALNTSMAIAEKQSTSALLIDFDLNSGMIRFMLKLENPYSLLDAVEHCDALEEELWAQLVTHRGRLDLLHSGGLNPHIRIDPAQVRKLSDYARRNYQVICADLSGNLERYSVEVMKQSKRIFLVSTPEIASLHLAREKLAYLKSIELSDRISLIVNRFHKRSLISKEEIEDLMSLPVTMTFPNDYHRVHSSLTSATEIERNSELGKQFSKLADVILERKTPPNKVTKKRFVEYFSIAPAR